MMDRRGYVLGLGASLSLGLAGCLGSDDGPEQEARIYMEAVAENDGQKAEEMVHSESDIDRPIGVINDMIQEALATVDVEVVDAETNEEEDDYADTQVEIEVDQVATVYTMRIRVELRTEEIDGETEWRVWEVGGED